jgi:hypothetical protein
MGKTIKAVTKYAKKNLNIWTWVVMISWWWTQLPNIRLKKQRYYLDKASVDSFVNWKVQIKITHHDWMLFYWTKTYVSPSSIEVTLVKEMPSNDILQIS